MCIATFALPSAHPILNTTSYAGLVESTITSHDPVGIFAETDLVRLNGEPSPFTNPMTTDVGEGMGTKITENMYVGAQPGHNAADIMQPFSLFGIDVSPADFFSTTTASYDRLYN